MQQAIQLAPQTSSSSITPMIAGSPHSRYHVTRVDFKAICDEDKVSADALRAFEQVTNQKINDLRIRQGIPASFIPANEDLWIEMPLRRLEKLTYAEHDKDTYARVMADVSVPKVSVIDSQDTKKRKDKPPQKTLIERGYIKRRYIARIFAKQLPKTTVYLDEKSAFIIVDRFGNYIDDSGIAKNVVEEHLIQNQLGITQQYLYCFEKVNEDLAAIAWRKPPEPLARSAPITQIIKQSGELTTETTTKKPSASIAHTNESLSRTSIRGGYSLIEAAMIHKDSFGIQNNMPEELMSSVTQGQCLNLDTPCLNPDIPHPHLDGVRLEADQGQQNPDTKKNKEEFRRTSNKNKEDSAFLSSSSSSSSSFNSSTQIFDLEELRSAPLTAETIIGLSSVVLDVPDPEQIDTETWYAEWWKPAERLRIATATLTPQQAWQRIDFSTRYMTTPGSPSWWIAGRAKQTKITLRHVADNLTVQWSDLQRKHWQPPETTPYDGPTGSGYAQGYQGLNAPSTNQSMDEIIDDEAQASYGGSEPTVEASQRIEEQRFANEGMTKDQLQELAADIEQDYVLSLGGEALGEDLYVLGIEYAPDQWLRIETPEQWYNPTSEALNLINLALQYAQDINAAAGSNNTDTTITESQ